AGARCVGLSTVHATVVRHPVACHHHGESVEWGTAAALGARQEPGERLHGHDSGRRGRIVRRRGAWKPGRHDRAVAPSGERHGAAAAGGVMHAPVTTTNAGVLSGRRNPTIAARPVCVAHRANPPAAAGAPGWRTTYNVYGLVSAVSATNRIRRLKPRSLAYVGRSARAYASRSSARWRVAAWSAPDSIRQCDPGITPAACHKASSFTWVPDESPRDTNGPPTAAMRRNAAAAEAAAATRAGSAAGPTMANRLATNGRRSRAWPGPTSKRRSSAGACVITTSRSPLAAARRICPEGATTVANRGPVQGDSSAARTPACWTVDRDPTQNGVDAGRQAATIADRALRRLTTGNLHAER